MEHFAKARFTRGLAVATSLAVVITCGSPTPPGSSESRTGPLDHNSPVALRSIAYVEVILEPTNTILVGATAKGWALARTASGRPIWNTPKATWASNNLVVATVDSVTGLVRSLAVGAALIIATIDGVSGQATLTVTGSTPPPPPIAAVGVTLGASSLQIGQTTTASAVLRDASGNVLTGRAVTWSSSATAVAVVNASSGSVTAVAAGTANIRATSEGVSGYATLSVSAPPPPPPPPPPGGLVFASDWSTATGNTSTAVRDGTKWDEAFNISFTPDRVSVISAAGLSFPTGMPNVLALRYPNTLNGQLDQMYSGINKQNGWELPPVGGSLYFRMYFRFDIGGTGGGTHHPVQSCVAAGSGCGQSWMKFQKPSSGETIPFMIETNGTGSQSGTANHHIWGFFNLARNVTYRVEEQYERVATNTWIVRARLYDSSNNLIRSPSDFVCGFYHGGHTMGDDVQFPFGDPSFLRHRTIRNQGVGGGRGSDDPNHQRIYYGGFAVSLSGWIGAYVPGESP